VTVPAHAAPIAAPDVASALQAVRKAGLRLSSARRIVVEALFAASEPLTAEEVARRAACDLASAYRNLEILEAAGVIAHLHVGHGAGLYRPRAASAELVVCERCGVRAGLARSVTAQIRAAVWEASGFVARFDHFPLAGLCPRCAQEGEH